jgi:hypothetical protein
MHGIQVIQPYLGKKSQTNNYNIYLFATKMLLPLEIEIDGLL